MVVPFPTPPKVRPLISLLGERATPANSIRTNSNSPELSLLSGLVPPPNVVSADGGRPSIFAVPVGVFTAALPNNITPPQSPRFLLPVALEEVNTMGQDGVPTA